MSKSVNSQRRAEFAIDAQAVSRGTAFGRAVCLYGRKRQFYRIAISDDRVPKELRRLRAALRLAKRQLKKISANGDVARVFDVHQLILEDRTFIEKIEGVIGNEKVNAEWAVKTVSDAYVAQQKTIADEHIREKYIDLEDIADRILTALGGGSEAALVLEPDSVVVARELRPSTLIELAASEPKAIVTEHGGWTSHTFILARELGLPAVTGVKGLLRRVRSGDRILIDGYSGRVTVNPSEEKCAAVGHPARDESGSEFDTRPVNKPIRTLDGREIAIRANIDIPGVYSRAKRLGARGIGLYRSEFLFNQYKGFPTEQEQIRAYQRIAQQAGSDPVRIRTFDLGLEQLMSDSSAKEKNPALGLRAIRLMLVNRTEFRKQLRALLQASADFPIDIVLPMVSDLEEIAEVKQILDRERAFLERKQIAVGTPRLGAMIEVPSAVIIAEEIGREVDFFCLGTNDLAQYLLAVDRDNEGVADWFRTLHPAMIRSVRLVLDAASRCRIPVVVCGEMAGSPAYVALLVGLGATELSMNVNSMARVIRTIEGIAFEEAREIAHDVVGCKTATEVEELIRNRFSAKWSHLFNGEPLPSRTYHGRSRKN